MMGRDPAVVSTAMSRRPERPARLSGRAARQQAEVLRIDGPPNETAAAEAEAGLIEMEFRV